MGMVGFEALSDADAIELRAMIEEHVLHTDSPVGRSAIERFDALLKTGSFVKVMPHDYKRVLRGVAQAEEESAEGVPA
jgi:glutamate synthase domain-containing protein 3